MTIIELTPGERVILGDTGWAIELLEIKGHQVRVGCKVPAEVPVLREELVLQNTKAALPKINR